MEPTWVGRQLRWARRRAGMTQHELAAKVGMPQPSIARIERGTVSPRASTLIVLLAATGHRLSTEAIEPAPDHEAIRLHLRMSVPQRTRQALPASARRREASPVLIVRRLRRFGVPFVLVGELAEVAHGSPASIGRVIEVCHAATDVARERIARALESLDQDTNVGRLNLLTKTDAGDDYGHLMRNAVNLHVESGILVRVAALEDLIRIRRARGTPKDREAAAVLQAIDDLRS